MRVLVTGADGFVGGWLLQALAGAGHVATAAVRPGSPALEAGLGVPVVPLELTDGASVGAAVAGAPDAVVHLAAVASNHAARQDPGWAWTVNAAGTARLLEALAVLRDRGADPLALVVSSGEVYGAGEPRPRREADPCLPASPYAASKVAAEVAAGEVGRRTGLRVIVARPFTHTGPGQAATFALPGFAARIRAAARRGEHTVPTGNLHPVRDILDVRDVVRAYVALLERGVPGETYNVASGVGRPLADLFAALAERLGAAVEPAPDPALVRRSDLPHLVGDPAKLAAATGWRPALPLDRTLQDLIDAQAD
ncbi:MAG TPA: NAD-dependent epimerase/dehydratase family protein [Gemmatimonadales bacterium]|nr:NAD-dependent epimerase/dehydratase family protein [Gemmatimonadales bacterium]